MILHAITNEIRLVNYLLQSTIHTLYQHAPVSEYKTCE